MVIGSRMPWLRGLDSTWGAFGNAQFWLEENWIDVGHADGWAVLLLASTAAIVSAITMVRRLDYWLPLPILSAALFTLSIREFSFIRDQGDPDTGIELIVFGSGLALVAALLDGALHVVHGPPFFGGNKDRMKGETRTGRG